MAINELLAELAKMGVCNFEYEGPAVYCRPAGRVLDSLGRPERRMCRLCLSLMDRTGVRKRAFGDATASLEEA